MGIIYFDICSIPLFLMILFICYSRRMTKGNANNLFISLVFISLFSAVADLGIEFIGNMTPLSDLSFIVCEISTYVYLVLRNMTNVVLLLFLLTLTKTTSIFKQKWAKIIFSLPYTVIIILLIQNPFTHNVFVVTREAGYTRGPLMIVFYGIAFLYGIVGFLYCINCRRYLPPSRWTALLSIYLLGYISVVLQFIRPGILLEMFFTALGEMMITLTIMRPEERMDIDVGMLSWSSYLSDVKNIIRSRERVQIIVIRIHNSREIRNFLDDHRYNEYISEIADGIRALRWKKPNRVEIYFERPGMIYIMADGDEPGADDIEQRLTSKVSERIGRFEEAGVRFEPQICLIRCPDDLKNIDDIIGVGHKFHIMCANKQSFVRADDIIDSKEFAVEAHIEKILDRAVSDDLIEMYYQPIYDVKNGGFHSAEALARVMDPDYGVISPGVFIPAAETQGVIIPVGDKVLDSVFRFIAENDLDALGLSYIEINLSVAQCMESSLPDKIRALQNKYGTEPCCVNFEITETTFESISEIMLENVNELIGMGYSFALDDYGTGYSNIQRVNNIPLKLIKIDKSMLDEVGSENGRMILEHTVHMMQSIGKKLVAEGAETAGSVELLKNMNCDYIQGYYFSKPLPEKEFTGFIKEHNGLTQ